MLKILPFSAVYGSAGTRVHDSRLVDRPSCSGERLQWLSFVRHCPPVSSNLYTNLLCVAVICLSCCLTCLLSMQRHCCTAPRNAQRQDISNVLVPASPVMAELCSTSLPGPYAFVSIHSSNAVMIVCGYVYRVLLYLLLLPATVPQLNLIPPVRICSTTRRQKQNCQICCQLLRRAALAMSTRVSE